MQREVADPATFVNDKMNGFAVSDKAACLCTLGNQDGKSNECFRPQSLWEDSHSVEVMKAHCSKAFYS